jgi:Domain of unknown function (DUF4262)
MCELCDGVPYGQVMAGTRERIERNGFTMLGVEGARTWTYTIGLQAGFDHPELVMTGIDPRGANRVLTDVAQRVMAGERFDSASPELDLGYVPVRFGEVHPRQWALGRFNGWLNYYAWLDEGRPHCDAVQVMWPDDELRFPPDPDFCHEHGDCQPLLSIPPTRDVNRPPNRNRHRRRKR